MRRWTTAAGYLPRALAGSPDTAEVLDVSLDCFSQMAALRVFIA
jgi:hypothetical protein